MNFDLVTRLYLDGTRWFRSIAGASLRESPAGSGQGFGTERNPARVVSFSDGVFAIAITLLVLNIHAPQDTRHLIQGLAALWPSYLAYAVTFLLIGQVWANHHVMFDHIRVADRVVLFLNTLLLMDIAFLPFAASILSSAFLAGHGQRTAVVFYGVALEVAALLFNAIWEYARHGDRLHTTIDAVGAKAIGQRFRLALAWIATGTLLGGLLPVLGMVVIAAFIPFYWWPIPGETATTKARRVAIRPDPGTQVSQPPGNRESSDSTGDTDINQPLHRRLTAAMVTCRRPCRGRSARPIRCPAA